MSAPTEEVEIQIGASDAGRRVDVVLAERMSYRSRTELQGLLRGGRVRIHEDWMRTTPAAAVTRPSRRLRSGELVVVTLDAAFVETGDGPVAALPDDCILWEDEHLIAVDKPSGWSLHPSRSHRSGSLLERLHRREALRHLGGPVQSLPTPCHRLDRDTSGIVLFARTAAARRELGRRLEYEHDAIEKTYLAVVRAAVAPPSETVVDLAIGPDLESEVPVRRRAVPPPTGTDSAPTPSTGERPASTLWRTVSWSPGRALVRLRPVTGRQHQLRVHAAALGFPILGDTLYLGGDELFLRSRTGRATAEDVAVLGCSRLALHSHRLRFRHPVAGTPVDVLSPLPDELRALLPESMEGGPTTL